MPRRPSADAPPLSPPADDEVQKIAGRTADAVGEGARLPILHALTDAFGYVPETAVPVVADLLNLSRAEVHGVVTFYEDFRLTPPTGRVVRLCRAEACQARGAQALHDAARALARRAGPDRLVVEDVFCLGLCASGPSGVIDGRQLARLTPERLDALLRGEAA